MTARFCSTRTKWHGAGWTILKASVSTTAWRSCAGRAVMRYSWTRTRGATGSGDVTLYAADEEAFTVMSRTTAERLGSYDAIVAHFAAADFHVPHFRFGP